MEEIEWLDEELTNLTTELTEKLKEVTSRDSKKLSKGVREDKVRREDGSSLSAGVAAFTK